MPTPTDVNGQGPPTLLMHGTHDEMAPVTAVRQMQTRPARHGLERFLAVLSGTELRAART